MFKVTGKNLYAANLLAYLEGKFNLMLELENKSGGWMKLNKMQIKNGIFADEWDYYNIAMDTLKALEFIAVDEEGSPEFPLGNYELWVKLDALKINQWLDDYTKTKGELQSPVIELMPYFVFLQQHKLLPLEVQPHQAVVLEQLQNGHVRVPEQQSLIEVGEKKRKPRAKKTIELDNSMIGTAKELFAFWKMKTGHKRSNLQDKYAKMAMDRMKEGYTPVQIAQAIIGLTHSDFHIQNNYDHFEYVVRNAKNMDKFCDLAEKNSVTETEASKIYSEFVEQLRSGAEIQYETTTFKNPITGRELK
jgi:hypothetical protein